MNNIKINIQLQKDDQELKKTTAGFRYLEKNGILIQQDRYGDWNIFVGYLFRESCANLSDAMKKAGLNK